MRCTLCKAMPHESRVAPRGKHFPRDSFNEFIIDDFSGLHDVNVIRDSTQNMNWSLAGFKEGDTTTTFSGNVINKLKDAYMVMEVMDNAGNSSRIRYSYTAPKITIPDSLSFEKIKVLTKS